MNWSNVVDTVGGVLSRELFSIGSTPVTGSTLVATAIVFIASLLISRLVRRVLRRALTRREVRETTSEAVLSLLHYVILVIGVGIGLQTLGIDLTALFAAGAVFAVGIGFAMKNIAENFVSGIILLVERSIRPGDIIVVEGRIVKVVSMGIRATTAQTRDSEDLILPNSVLVQSTVFNYTLRESVYRTRVPVGVLYSSDMAEVMKVLRKAGERAAETIDEVDQSRGVEVLLTDFGSSSVDFEVGMFLREPWRTRAIRSKIYQVVWDDLAQAGITIAFPQVDVHFDEPVARGLAAMSGGR